MGTVRKFEVEFLSPREVAEVFGIATGTLANYRCKRIGPKFYRLGGHKIAYRREDLEAWARREPVLTRDSAGADQ